MLWASIRKLSDFTSICQNLRQFRSISRERKMQSIFFMVNGKSHWSKCEFSGRPMTLDSNTLAFTFHKWRNHTWHLSSASDLVGLIPTRSYRQRLEKLAFVCVSSRRTTTTSLNLWFLRVIGVYLLPTLLPLNQALRWREWREWSPTTEALDFWTNSPC